MALKERKAEMELICPKCVAPIDPDKVNIQRDEVRCSYCGSDHKVNELYEQEIPTPPPGSIIEVSQDAEGHILRLPSDPRVPFKTKLLYIVIILSLVMAVVFFGRSLLTESHPYANYLFLGLLFFVGSMSYFFWGFLSTWSGEHSLKIRRKKVELVIKGLFRKKLQRVAKEDIYGVSLEMPRKIGGKDGYKTPAIITEKGKHLFFHYASQAEKEWAVKHLRTVMKSPLNQTLYSFMESNCSHCGASIPSDHINVSTGLTKCPECGDIDKMNKAAFPSGNDKEGKREAQPPPFPDSEPPKGSRIRVLKKGDHELKLFLPGSKGVLFLVPLLITSAIGIVFLIVFINLITSDAKFNGLLVWLLIPLLVLLIFSSIANRFNQLLATETLEVEGGQLRVQEDRPFRLPLFHNGQRRIFELDKIQGVELKFLRKRIGRLYSVFLVFGDREEEILKRSSVVGKKWLAEYLDRLVRENRGMNA